MPLLSPAEVLEKTAALQAADASGKILARRFSKVAELGHGERYPEDDFGKEPARRDLAGIMAHKWQDHISGGLAEGKKPSDFPAEDLVLGMTVEMEHTSDPAVACEIAMDHLTEKPDYYRTGDMAKEVEEALEKVEDGAITLAKQAGVLVARMSKEALFNPLKIMKPALGRLARPAEGAAVKGVVGALEHAPHAALDPIQAAVAKAHPTPQLTEGASHLLETGKALPAGHQGWVAKANRNIERPATSVGPKGWSAKANRSIARSNASQAAPAGAPGTVASPANAVQGSVAPPGAAVKRFGWGKALGVGALGLGAYGAAEVIPAVAKKVDETSSMPLAYDRVWSATPYGYGSTPYGSGMQTMGPGA